MSSYKPPTFESVIADLDKTIKAMERHHAIYHADCRLAVTFSSVIDRPEKKS